MEEGLADIIELGGIHRAVKGTTPREVLSSLIDSLIGPIPSAGSRTISDKAASDWSEKLLEAVLEREALMSTGIGKGLALPHPRNPFAPPENSGQFAALAFLEQPVNWHSLDGQKVDTVLLIVSSTAKQHLRALSEINFFCRQDEFYQLLKKRADKEELFAYIRETEKKWNAPK